MRHILIILFCSISVTILSQNKIIQKLETKAKEIEISTLGLDDFLIENSNTNFIEIILTVEDLENQQIVFNEEFNLIKIQFKLPDNKLEELLFRKFITKRLQRASAIIKVPKNKAITIFGNEINVESKSYKGDLSFFIEKGILKLHTIQADLVVKMYMGSIYAELKKTNVNVACKTGVVKINGVLVGKNYQEKEEKSDKKVIINSAKANIFLTTKKTQ